MVSHCYLAFFVWFMYLFISFWDELINSVPSASSCFSVFLTLFRSDFGTESKRKKNPEMIFPERKKSRETFGQVRWAPGSPQGPTPPPGGRRRWASLWLPWPPPDLGFAPIYSPIFRKKSGEPWKYFSAAASFRFREISSGDPSRRPAGGDFGAGGLLHHHHRPSNDSWVVHFRPTGP